MFDQGPKDDLPLADHNVLEMIDAAHMESTHRWAAEDDPVLRGDRHHRDEWRHSVQASFIPDLEDRRAIIDNKDVVIFNRVNRGYKKFELDREKHKIGSPIWPNELYELINSSFKLWIWNFVEKYMMFIVHCTYHFMPCLWLLILFP